MFISIITINYKKSDLTIACIESLYGVFEKKFLDNQMELIIVDNASDDGSVLKLREKIKNRNYKNVNLIENDLNSGFGKGSNTGARRAKGKYLLFLNNDTEAKDPRIIKMAEYMDKNQDVSILGGQLSNPDGSLQASSGNFYTLGRAILMLLGTQKYSFFGTDPKAIARVDWVTGGFLMIRKKVFDGLGGFDDKIFMYAEDMEFCYRAKMKGLNTYFFPDVLVIHAQHGSGSRTFAIVNIYKNLLYFYKKHKSPPEYLILKFLLIAKALILIAAGWALNNSYLTKTYKTALSAI